jgi:hypothetical protein
MAESKEDDEVKQAQAMAAMKILPWDEWVKWYAKCHHFQEKGHICSHCPIYIEKAKSGKIR